MRRKRGLSRNMRKLLWYYTSGYPGVSREIQAAWDRGEAFYVQRELVRRNSAVIALEESL